MQLDLSAIPSSKLELIRSEFSETYHSLTERYSHKQSKVFAEKLIKTSKSLKIKELEEFTIEFLATLNLFEIEHIRKMLQEYDKLFLNGHSKK